MSPIFFARQWLVSRGAPHRLENHPQAELPPLPCAWECDLADDSLHWSRGVFELFGIDQGTRVDRRDVVEMYTDESRALLERLRSRAIAECGSFTFEAQIARTDGSLRWIRIIADVVARNGRARRLYGMKQDITAEMPVERPERQPRGFLSRPREEGVYLPGWGKLHSSLRERTIQD